MLRVEAYFEAGCRGRWGGREDAVGLQGGNNALIEAEGQIGARG